LNVQVGESFGLFAGGSVVKMNYKKRLSFWRNARKYQRKLAWNLRDKKVFWIYKGVHSNVPLDVLDELGPIFIEVVGRQDPFGLTNLGSLDRMGLVLDTEKFYIESFYGALSFAIGAVIVLVYTMRKRMHFHFHYLKSIHDEERMKNTMEEASETILSLLE
jgi:hypothetical protein